MLKPGKKEIHEAVVKVVRRHYAEMLFNNSSPETDEQKQNVAEAIRGLKHLRRPVIRPTSVTLHRRRKRYVRASSQNEPNELLATIATGIAAPFVFVGLIVCGVGFVSAIASLFR